MGRRGPQPKPTKLKVLEGNPGKRRLGHEVEPIAPLAIPDVVVATPAAEAEWRRAVASMPPGFFTGADASVLTVYCMSWVIYRNALATIAREGLTMEGVQSKTIANPAVAVADKAAARILQAADRLGMSPSARARMEAPAPVERPGGATYNEDDPDDDLLTG